MPQVIIFLLLLINILHGYDDDFDGVDNINDRCLNTSFIDTVGKDGCPNNRIYIGNIVIDYEYLIQRTDIETSYIKSIYFDIDYKKFLFSFSKSYYEINKTKYVGDDYLSIGYNFYNKNFTNKSYIGIKKANKSSEISTNNDDYFINTAFYYNYTNRISFDISSQYNFIQDSSTQKYNNYINYSAGSSYNINNFKTSISYNNSGSTDEFSNVYKTLKISQQYNISNDFYVSINYSKSIININNDISCNIGYSYE